MLPFLGLPGLLAARLHSTTLLKDYIVPPSCSGRLSVTEKVTEKIIVARIMHYILKL